MATRSTVIRVICTGKGRHKARRMRSFTWTTAVDLPGGQRSGDWREARRPLQDSYAFACRHCGRNTQMTAATLRTVLDGFADTGLQELDVSLLPY